MRFDALWCPTRVFAGLGIVDRVLRAESRGRSVVLVFDPALEDQASAVRRAVRPHAEVAIRKPDLASLESASSVIRQARTDVVIALGGGSVLDTAKLAASMSADAHRFERFTRVVDRKGELGTGRPWRGEGPLLIAVPSTVGTASEVSPIACVTAAGGHRLIHGDDLRPQLAILDGACYESLPLSQVLSGGVEAFLRAAGPAVGMKLSPRAMTTCVELASRILTATQRLESEDTPGNRLELATLGAETRVSWGAHVGARHPIKHWYLANELAHFLSVPKMSATAGLVPELWRRIEAGDVRFGVKDSLLSFWAQVAAAAQLDPNRPVAGVEALFRRFGLDRTSLPNPLDDEPFARRVIAAWGGRSQALEAWDHELVTDVIRAARAGSGSRIADEARQAVLVASHGEGGEET